MKSLFGAVILLASLAAPALAQTPVALVEEIQGKVDGVEFMDYVVPGKVIKLGPRAILVLGYLKSCWRETIAGGTVIVGTEESMVHQGDVQRIKVPCDASAVQITDREGSQSAATTFRTVVKGEKPAPPPVIYSLSPLIETRSASGTLVIERSDRAGERITIPLNKEALQRGRFYDMANAGHVLTAGGTYTATLGDKRVRFKIDQLATAAASPLVGRLLQID